MVYDWFNALVMTRWQQIWWVLGGVVAVASGTPLQVSKGVPDVSAKHHKADAKQRQLLIPFVDIFFFPLLRSHTWQTSVIYGSLLSGKGKSFLSILSYRTKHCMLGRTCTAWQYLLNLLNCFEFSIWPGFPWNSDSWTLAVALFAPHLFSNNIDNNVSFLV